MILQPSLIRFHTVDARGGVSGYKPPAPPSDIQIAELQIPVECPCRMPLSNARANDKCRGSSAARAGLPVR